MMLHKKECHKTLKASPQKCFWKAAGFAAHSQRPPLSSRADNIFSCIRYLNHCPLPEVLKVFSVVLALYAHIVTIDTSY